MSRFFLVDNRRSVMLADEIQKFREQITKQRNSPICPNLNTFEVAEIGTKMMCADNYSLIEGQLDV